VLSSLSIASLANAPRWVAWQTEQNERGRVTKTPYSPSGGLASSTDPRTWGPLAAARLHEQQLDKPYGTGGVGFQLGDLGNGIAVGGIDLDSCRDPETGAIEDWAKEIINRLGTYTETSPSGTGAKCFFLYDPMALTDLLQIMGTKGGKKWVRGKGEHPPSIELYLACRYFAVTNERLGTAELRNVPREILEQLIKVDGPAFAGKAPKSESAKGSEPGSFEAECPHEWDRLRRRVEAAAALTPSLAQLWRGEFGHLNDMSRSGIAMGMGRCLRNAGLTFTEMATVLRNWEHTADWCSEKGDANGGRELKNIWARAGEKTNTGERTSPEGGETSDPRADACGKLLSIEDVEGLPDPVWIVDGLLPEQGLAIAYGAAKHGKSFLMLSAALHIAAGRDWFGRQVRQGAIVYICGEGAGGLKLRIRAARAHYRIPADIPFWTLPRAVNFSDMKAVTELADLIRETAGSEPIRMVIVDTLARAMPGLDENSAGDVGRVIAACDWLKEQLGCTVLQSTMQARITRRACAAAAPSMARSIPCCTSPATTARRAKTSLP